MAKLDASLELKFDDGEAGEFHGIASPFGNVDSHGDAVQPGAFAASLAEHKARGTLPHMFVNHGPYVGGDTLPAGVWTDMEEAPDGLRVKGKISALDTDRGRTIRALMRDGALRSLSIGYKVPEGGASFPKARTAGDPRRLLNKIDLWEVSLVPAGSNSRARVEGIKADLMSEEIEDFRARIQSKNPPTERELERFLRDVGGLSRSDAADLVAGRGWKTLRTRDAASEARSAAAQKAIADLGAALGGFTLPKF